MASDSIKSKARSGVLWGAGSQAISLVLQLLQSIVAARILGPEGFAEIAVIYIVSAIALPFAQSGLGVAIIYFKERDQKRIAQVQTLSILLATLVAGAIYAVAHPVAAYFRLEHAAALIELSAVTVWFSALSSVWQAQLKRNLTFRDVEAAYLASYAMGFALVMVLLATGFGAASVVLGQAAAAALNAAFVRLALNKRGMACGLAWPGPGVFPHLRYGGANTISAIASVLNDRVDAMLIGGRLSAAAFGTYGLFGRVMTALSTPVQRIKTQVEFPTYTHIVDDPPRLRRAFTKALMLTSLATFPVFLGLAAVSDLAIDLLLGERWREHSAVLSVVCVHGLLRIVSSSSTPVFMAAGLVRRALIFVFARLAVTPIMLMATLALSPTLIAVAVAMAIMQVGVTVANYLLFVRPVLGPCAAALAAVVARPLVASLVMIAAVALARRFVEASSDVLTAAAAVGAGAASYGLATLLLNRSALKECLYLFRPLTDTMRGPQARPTIVD